MIGHESTGDGAGIFGGSAETAGGLCRAGDAGLADGTAQIVDLADLGRYRRAIADLAAGARESNVFFEPIVLDAALRETRRIDRMKLLLVWRDADRTVLSGTLPLRVDRHHWGPFGAVLLGWKHEYGIRGTPLIAPGQARPFWAAALDAVRRSTLPRYLILPAMAADGDCMNGLRAAADAPGRRIHVVGREAHITMRADGDGEAFLRGAMSDRRYKRMLKNRRDLEKRGDLRSRLYTDPGDVMVAFRRYAELEAAGWKGRNDGAMLRKPDAFRFFFRAVCDFAVEGRVRVDALELDGEPIGMSIAVVSGHTAFCWKTTYDERFSKYSPGMLTVMDVTRGIAADPRVTFADSCTDIGHPMMGALWSDTAAAIDLLVDTKPESRAATFTLAIAAEAARRQARSRAKKVYHALRGHLRKWRDIARRSG